MTRVNRQAAVEYIRRNLTAYKRLMYRSYRHAPHLAALDDLLMQVTRYTETGGAEGIGRAIVEMPPRHGKTLTTSRLFPTWHLGRNPEHRIMLVSYGATLAHRNSRMARNLMRSPRYFDTFGLRLAGDSAAVDSWNVAGHEGGCDALGITAGATGKGAHCLILDDPLKSRAEAESEVYRNAVWDAFTVDLYSRLEPGGAVVVMMTRWHQDDLIGRLLKYEPDKWHRLRLPALAEPDDPLGRRENAPLWAMRYPAHVLADIKDTLGPYNWSALYQQRPTPSEGGIFKRSWFDTVEREPINIVHTVRFWDLAMSAKTSADYTVGVKIGQGDDGHYYVMDVARRQVDWGELVNWMAEVMLLDGPAVAQGVEAQGYMTRAVQDLNEDARLHNFDIRGYTVDKDKLTRALPFAAKCAAGVMHVLDRHWTRDYLDELCSFPTAAHDDQVDASSGAWSMIGEGVALGFASLSYADNPRAIGW